MPMTIFKGKTPSKKQKVTFQKGSDVKASKRARQKVAVCGALNIVLVVCLIVVVALYILKGKCHYHLRKFYEIRYLLSSKQLETIE